MFDYEKHELGKRKTKINKLPAQRDVKVVTSKILLGTAKQLDRIRNKLQTALQINF